MRRTAFLVALAAALVLAQAARSYYTAPLTGTASGAAAAASLGQGPVPSIAVGGGRTVTVSWGQAVFSNGAAVPGYVIRRYQADSPYALQTVGIGCSGTIAALTCTESAVPPGNWAYTVTPVAGTSWLGSEGIKSGSAIVGAAALTFAAAYVAPSLPRTMSGSLTGFGANEGITFRLDDPTTGAVLTGSPAAADGTGAASVSVTIPSGTSEGPHTVYAVGSLAPPSNASAALIVDTVAPVSQATGADTAWHAAAVTVTLSATDGSAGSGVAAVTYAIDGGAVQTIPGASGQIVVAAPADHSADGTHTILFSATDRAGNSESPAHAATVKIDTTAPATTAATSPASPDGTNGWFQRSSVGLTLTAADPAPASGVASTYYSVDGGPTQLYAGAASVSTPGAHTVAYWSADAAGNTEPQRTLVLKLDNAKPVTTLSASPSTPNGLAAWYTTAPTFTLTASDADSGVAARYYTLDGGSAQTYSSPVVVGDGTHTVAYWSVDNAGNLEASSSAAFKTDTAPPTTVDDTATTGSGWFNVTKTVLLTPSDSASGVASTHFTSDGSAPTVASSSGTSVPLSTDGVYTVKYFSTDVAGNNETVKTAAVPIHIDKTPPTAGAVATSGAYTSGVTFIRNGQALTSAPTDATVNGASSGVASVAYYSCAGTCTPSPGVAGTALVGTSSSGGSYSVAWSSQPADGVYSLRARVTDHAGNTADSGVIARTVDNTPPATTDNSAAVGSAWSATTKVVTLSPTDAGSGVASTHFTVDGTTPTGASSAGTSVSLAADGVYTVKYFSTDNAGTSESVETAGTTVRIDKSAPTPGAVTFAGAYVGAATFIKNGQALTDAATDANVNGASSGVASVAYLYCSVAVSGSSCVPSTSIGSSASAGSFSVAWSSQPADGQYRVAALVTDAAGNTATSAVSPVTVDNTAPATTDNSASVGSGWFNVAKTVTLSPSDAGSGVAATHYTIDGTTPTAASPLGATATLWADGLYTVKYFSTDNLGTSETVRAAGTTVRIDQTAPTPAAIGAGGAYAGGGVTYVKTGAVLTDSATDATVNGASSGVASVAYYVCAGACTPSPGVAGTTLIGSSSTASSYSFAWNVQPADGAYSVLARVTDVAGNTADSAVLALTIDNTVPTVTATVADATANEAGYINGASTFYAYATAADLSSGLKSVTANLSAQCSGCTAVALTTAGGPFTVLNGSGAGTTTYAYRSAALTSITTPTSNYSVTAADNVGNAKILSGTVAIDGAAAPAAPTAVTLTTGYAATSYAVCTQIANGAINAAHAASETVTVTTASGSPAKGVVRLTVSGSPIVLSSVVPGSGTQTVSFAGIDLSGHADGSVTLSAVEYTPGGNGTSIAKTQAVTKLTVAAAIATASLVYTDNTASTADQVTGSGGAGPGQGYLKFTQTAGTHSGSSYLSPKLTSTGSFGVMSLAPEIAKPTYSVAAVDGACNAGTAVAWSPADSR